MRLGFPLYVPARYGANPAIRAQSLPPGALPFFRFACLSALAGSLLPCLVAGSGDAQRDGGIAVDPAQPDRARGADDRGRGAGAVASRWLEEAVSLRCDACKCDQGIGASQAIR